MKSLMYLKNDFVSKEAFSRDNSQIGLRKIYRVGFENFYRGGPKFCQLGRGVPR